jgi:hypothetical protein
MSSSRAVAERSSTPPPQKSGGTSPRFRATFRSSRTWTVIGRRLEGACQPQRVQRDQGGLALLRAHLDHGPQGPQDSGERGQPRSDRHAWPSGAEQDVRRWIDRPLSRQGPARPSGSTRGHRGRRVVPRVGRQPLHLGHRAVRRRRLGASVKRQLPAHGALFALRGEARKAKRYHVGNPLIVFRPRRTSGPACTRRSRCASTRQVPRPFASSSTAHRLCSASSVIEAWPRRRWVWMPNWRP